MKQYDSLNSQILSTYHHHPRQGIHNLIYNHLLICLFETFFLVGFFLLFANNNGPTTICSEWPMYPKLYAFISPQCLIPFLSFLLNRIAVFWIIKLNYNGVSLKQFPNNSHVLLPFNGSISRTINKFHIILSKVYSYSHETLYYTRWLYIRSNYSMVHILVNVFLYFLHHTFCNLHHLITVIFYGNFYLVLNWSKNRKKLYEPIIFNYLEWSQALRCTLY